MILYHGTNLDIEHIDNAVRSHNAFADTGEEAVAAEVVEAVHIKLAADKLVEKMFRISIREDADCGGETASELLVKTFHEQEGAVLVVHVGKRMFGSVGEGAMAYVVQENGKTRADLLVVGEFYAFHLEDFEGAVHETECTQSVAEAGVHSTRVDQICEAQLLDSTQTLKERMREDVEDNVVLDGEKAVYWVVDNLSLIRHAVNFFVNCCFVNCEL